MITEDPQLEMRLRHYGSTVRQEARVSPELHARIIARVGHHAPARPYRMLVQLAAAAAMVLVALGAMGVVLKLRADELAKASPHVTSVFPAAGATHVPLKGEFRVSFSARPSGLAVLRVSPADAVLQPARWVDTTMIVAYAGLHPSAQYELILSADYRDHLGDRGHFEKRWTFTAEGPAQITALVPAAGERNAARNGQITVQFARRPVVDPVVRIEPADGTLMPGSWTDTTWTVPYSGLQPLRTYQATLDLSFGSPGADFHRAWSFISEPGTPPGNIALIWYATSSRFASPMPTPTPQASNAPNATTLYRMVALDWSGAVVGSLYLSGPALQAPDGTRLDFGAGTIDQAGRQVATSTSTKGGPGFADDSRHMCAMRNAAGGDFGGPEPEPGWIFAGPIGGPLHRIAQAGSVGGQSGPRIVACSYQNDRAVVVEDVIMWTSEVWVYRLSTGALLYHHQYSSGAVASSVMASRDGRYLAEQTTSTDAQGHQIYADTIIRRTSDGAVVARLSGQTVNAFSWDGSRVITMPALGSPESHEVRLVDWQRGQTLWRLAEPPGIAPGFAYVFSLGRPGGTDLIVGVAANSTGQSPVDQLWLVHADGAATSVAKGPIIPSFQEGF